MNRLEHELTALEKGHELVILHEGSKAPIFRNWPDRCPDAQEAAWWDRRGKNYGIKLRELVVLDKDASSRKAYDWMRGRRIHRSPMEVETRRGVHIYFRLAASAEDVRAKIHFLGLPVDILLGNRFAVGPGSTVTTDGETFTYSLREGTQIVGPEELPVFPVDILQQQARREVIARVNPPSIVKVLDEKTRNYIATFEPSEQGKGGSRACFVACLKLLTRTGGDVEAAWPMLIYWNAIKATPPWDTEKETGPDSLRRKLREARERWTPR